ncbi:uncharacterized protein IL334_003241 [Kwoniella shivajii]|uniref:Uncharacterized protein n=1 Tax=Kwoniella shivajii TaxID=564305 RepID=A0ABZ1CX17_9TREE|nr:hypothetical protein IL334_003241 [Kwoniella shivajii]
MRSIFFTPLLLLLFSIFATFVLGDYVDMVIESEKALAVEIDQYANDHPDTYDFIARTHDDKIIIQIKFEDDTVGIQGFFTPTPELEEDLSNAHLSIIQSTIASGMEGQGSSLEDLQGYRYHPDHDIDGGLNKRLVCQPCRTCLRDINEHLTKRVSLCGQFCSTRLSCVVLGCRRCYYTGGACYWQKSCQRVSLPFIFL